MRKILSNFSKLSLFSLALSLFFVSSTFAHVVVKPGEVNTGTYVTFTVGVPNEKAIDTNGVKIMIPEGLSSVTPTVKQGWIITTEKQDNEDVGGHSGSKVVSIEWSGGVIPEGQRDEFTFSAKTPSEAGDLEWMAYQTYSDGTVVAWDKSEEEQPKKEDGSPDFSASGPFSVTKVNNSDNSLSNNSEEASSNALLDEIDQKANRAFYASIAAVVVALISIALATRTRK